MSAVTPELLLARLDALASELERRDDALALLALGSVGRERDRLDRWSDLDFFVIVRDGAKQAYIGRLDWLAAAHPLAWYFQNTADGHKALMADGVFCEFAVFEQHELRGIPYSPGRFVWRRDEMDATLAAPRRALPERAGKDWLVGEALSNLLIGLQRHARGEKLAAMRMVQVYALDRVLELLDAQSSSAPRDPFNVDRRVEQRNPGLAQMLPRLAGGYEATVPAALAMLEVLEQQAQVPQALSRHLRDLASSA